MLEIKKKAEIEINLYVTKIDEIKVVSSITKAFVCSFPFV